MKQKLVDIQTRAANRANNSISGLSSRRLEIIGTAIQLFNKRGVTSGTLDELAAMLGVKKASLYHHFKDKDEIVLLCIELAHFLVLEELDRINNMGGSGADKLRGMMGTLITVLQSEGGRFFNRIDVLELSPHVRNARVTLRRDVVDHLAGIVEIGIEDGSLKRCKPPIVAASILSALTWIATLDVGIETPVQELSEVLGSLFLDGIGA